MVVHHSADLATQGVPQQFTTGPRLSVPPELVRQLHGIWLQFRSEWAWIVLVSADPDFSITQLAKALSDVGARLSGRPVDFIEATDVDLDNASWLIGRLGTTAAEPSAGFRREESEPGPSGWVKTVTKTVVALENPVQNPLALPIALAADGVILCVRRGQTSLTDVRRTIEAVGADRLLCCVMVD